MKIYIESLEQGEGEDLDFIKEEIKTTEQDAKDIVKSKEKSDKTYKYRKHYCYHDEGESCTTEEIKL